MNSKNDGSQQFLSGTFQSLESAIASANVINESSAAFISSTWFERQKTFYELSLTGISPRMSRLPKLIDESNVNFLVDVGGGSGWCWNLIKIEHRKKLTYVNIELPETCNYFSKNSPDIKFVSQLDDVHIPHESAAMLYSNSCMQYISDIYMLEIFSHLKSCTEIHLDDMILTDSSGFWTLQEYYGQKIPYRVRNREKFVGIMIELGYQQKMLQQINVGTPFSFKEDLPIFSENFSFFKIF